MIGNNGEIVRTPSEEDLNSAQRSWLAYRRQKTGNSELTFDAADALLGQEDEELVRAEELDRAFERGFKKGVILDLERIDELEAGAEEVARVDALSTRLRQLRQRMEDELAKERDGNGPTI